MAAKKEKKEKIEQTVESTEDTTAAPVREKVSIEDTPLGHKRPNSARMPL